MYNFSQKFVTVFLVCFSLVVHKKVLFSWYSPDQVIWFNRTTVARVKTKPRFAWKTMIITSCVQQHFEITFEKTTWNTPSKVTVSFFSLTKYSYITVAFQNPPVTVFSGAAAQLERLTVEISRSNIIRHTLDSTRHKERSYRGKVRYLQNTKKHKKRTSMVSDGLEAAVPAIERPPT